MKLRGEGLHRDKDRKVRLNASGIVNERLGGLMRAAILDSGLVGWSRNRSRGVTRVVTVDVDESTCTL